MNGRSRARDRLGSSDGGNAMLEFVAVAVVLMIPISYAIIAAAQLESDIYGVTGAAQMAARAYANSNSDFLGRYAAARSAAIAGRNHELYITSDQVTVTCGVSNCLTPGTRVSVSVTTTARIGVGPFTRVVPLHSRHAFVMDPFRQEPS